MRILLLASLIVLTGNTFAQLTPDKVANALDSFAFLHPQEKVFVHSDRDAFAAGQTVWFKAYITLDGRPTNLSKQLYVELVNGQGQLVARRLVRAENGSGYGEILLKDSLASGTYTLNAYTLWMLNFPGFIFKKNISIHNFAEKKGRSTPSSDFHVQFLPEGGHLVAGLESRVAFKAVAANGLPLNVKGTVTDSKKNVVASLTTTHDGMGVFTFTPRSGELYTASVSAPGDRTNLFNLPTPLPEGVVLTVNNDNPNRIFVQVNRSETNKAKYNELLLVAQTNYEVIFTAKLDFEAGMTGAPISKKDLPPGIMQITIMNMQGLPLAERLVFVNNVETPSAATLRLDTVNTGQRKRNFYTIDLAGYSGVDASVAIVNADVAGGNASENIASSILLTSDIKGHVYNPGFYFRSKDTSTMRALDLLMMTQGWRRFNWEKVVKNEHPVLKFPFETGIAVKGKLTGADGKKGVANGKLELITKAEDSTTILSTATVNDKNEFSVFDLNFRKEATVYYQGTNMNRQGALVNVNIYPAYFDSAKSARGLAEADTYSEFAVNEYWKGLESDKARVDSAIGKTLATVTVTGRRRSPVDSLNKLYATDIFYQSDQTIALDSNDHFVDIWQFLNRQVPGIAIVNTDTGKRVYFTRYAGVDAFSESGGSSVAFFLNEVPVSADIIDALHPDDVGMVKIYKGVTGIILGADRGAIAVYTKKGRSGRDWRKSGFDSFKLSGYSVSREFYHPGPSNTKDVPDIRPTLYWNP
ncbi:MAG TPA: hypothetical protein VFZ47_08975, partial [Chitinophagaceae bacterium]